MGIYINQKIIDEKRKKADQTSNEEIEKLKQELAMCQQSIVELTSLASVMTQK